tara:strand:- start:10760 stop:11161 length:402 start_codon:yes stop_codon:yes gene_type:complete
MNKMNILMDRVEGVVSGTDRGLLIVSDNQFLKQQIERFLIAKNKTYRWFSGDVTVNAFFELLTGKHILVFDGLNYNKRGVDGLLYRIVVEPIGRSVKIILGQKETEFDGRIILFGAVVIENPSIRGCFNVWTE